MHHMNQILDKLMTEQNRQSTRHNYLAVWRKFNSFLIRLDHRPKDWEDRASLFGAYLVKIQGVQSATLKSYFSAIKAVLKSDKYKWDNSKVLLHSLVKACKIQNDKLWPRFPIRFGLMEMLLYELNLLFSSQPYLNMMYKALFSLAYYGLMRVGELTMSPHTVKAANIHVGSNKNKIIIVLYTSKTHDEVVMPQKIKISEKEESSHNSKNFCPFQLIRRFITIRGDYDSTDEMFFVLSDRSLVTPTMARTVLAQLLRSLNLDPSLYPFHMFRSGRASDLLKYGIQVEKIKQMGHWRSNAVYRYLKN